MRRDRIAALERRLGVRERVRAHLVLDTCEQAKPESQVHYWLNNEPSTLTLENFCKRFPESEIVVLRIAYLGEL